ncbi:MAG: hypothetical protein ACRESZ_12845, partial [Methylococcales bacterium]
MAKPINFFVPEGMMGRRNPYKYGKVHSRPHQRGAIGIFGALVLSIGLLFAVLSIDSGRLFVEDRRLQKIADLAALDGSKIGGICGAGAAAAAQA